MKKNILILTLLISISSNTYPGFIGGLGILGSPAKLVLGSFAQAARSAIGMLTGSSGSNRRNINGYRNPKYYHPTKNPLFTKDGKLIRDPKNR